jgi:dihydrolipoamide dehydrogenase
MLHVAAVLDEVAHFDRVGVTFAAPTIDRGKLVAHKNKVVGKLTGASAQMAKMRKVTVVTGTGRFTDDHHAASSSPPAARRRSASPARSSPPAPRR